jgi:exodeoxyribonuclease V alpha subunit
MKLGIEKTAMIRARAGISYALTEALDDGHCGLSRDELLPLAVELLEIPEALIVDALKLELDAGAVIADTVENRPCVFLAGLYRAEQSIVARLTALKAGRTPWPAIDAEKAIPWVEEKTGLTLADSQEAAVRTALASKLMVITGGPGVGKTTLVNSILKILAAKRVDLLLCAPTGRAAKRMTETTGREAKTIHRLLEVDPKTGGFKRNDENPLQCERLVDADAIRDEIASAKVEARPSDWRTNIRERSRGSYLISSSATHLGNLHDHFGRADHRLADFGRHAW